MTFQQAKTKAIRRQAETGADYYVYLDEEQGYVAVDGFDADVFYGSETAFYATPA